MNFTEHIKEHAPKYAFALVLPFMASCATSGTSGYNKIFNDLACSTITNPTLKRTCRQTAAEKQRQDKQKERETQKQQIK